MATKEWKEKNKEKMREYRRAYYRKNKEDHYERNSTTNSKLKAYSDSCKSVGCLLCDEKEICCMDFHHLKDKSEDISKLLRAGSLKRLKEEIEKCVVLCTNCHRKLHAGLVELNTPV